MAASGKSTIELARERRSRDAKIRNAAKDQDTEPEPEPSP